jgi:molybdate transport system substrate-binding protein
MKLGPLNILIIGAAIMLAQAAHAADIKVLCTGAARPAYEELRPQFEMATGHRLVTEFALPPVLVKKMDAGEPFDVMILSYDIEDLIRQGKLAAGSRVALGRIGVGVAVKKGAPKPDFSTVEKFKQMMLDARAIATSGQGSSGRYVDSLIEKLGIAAQVRPKIKSGGPGEAARIVSRGEVDFVVSGLPPLIGHPDIEWLGLIPDEIQHWLTFSGGVNVKAKEPAAGRELLKFLITPAAVAVFKAKGLDPVAP